MPTMTLSDLSEKMRHIDFTMLITRTENGEVSGRPMSNNGDVDYDGDSYFFTYDHTRMAADIRRDRKVNLSLQGKQGLLGKPPIFISVEADAELIFDRSQFEAHWTKDLERWFEQGTQTPGLVLIKAHATRIHYWDGEENGEVKLSQATG